MAERSMENKSSQKEAIMAANNLKYVFDDILNVSVNRTAKKQYFDTRTYTMPGAGQAVSTWNSGVDLIDVANSYLKFTVRFDEEKKVNDGLASFSTGSAMNLIKEVKILSSSGIELARTQDANLYHRLTSSGRHPADWKTTVGSLMGADHKDDGTGQELKLDSATPYTFVIPLTELDPYFELYDGKLLPANIASGLRVEITWEDLDRAIHTTAGTAATSYVITGIEFRTEAVTLADSAMAILNKEAATNGLEITYDRIYTSSKNTGTALDDNVEIRKAVSLAKDVIAVTMPTASLNSQGADSFATDLHTFTSADVRLGNQYYPYQPIENAVEGYQHFLKHYNKLKSRYPTSVRVEDYVSNNAQITAKFETDDSLNLTGLPINSSRIVEVRFARSVATDVKTYVFLRYTALTRASLTNTSVKI